MIPTYILESGEVTAVSLVLDPAVEKDFMCFSKQDVIQLNFNNEKRIITGVAMIADTPIYRYDNIHGEHYVVFSKDLIEKLVIDYFKNDNVDKVRIDHNTNVNDIVIFESYIVNDKIKSNLFDVPEGSWIISYKVNNADVYEKIKAGTLKGFSIEGLFTYPEIKEEKDMLDEFIKNFL